MARWKPVDVLLVAAVGLAAFLFAKWYNTAYRAAGGEPLFYQREFGPAVMLACGRGFVEPRTADRPGAAGFPGPASRAGPMRGAACVDPARPARCVPEFQPLFDDGRRARAARQHIRWGAVVSVDGRLLRRRDLGGYVALRFVCGRTLSLAGRAVVGYFALAPAKLTASRDYPKVPFFAVMLIAIADAVF